uniref:Ig-like domain-containing protein n=1 Tax=Myripristis murdjan TaxID=586833 RepID=A0A667Z6P3_9TELE
NTPLILYIFVCLQSQLIGPLQPIVAMIGHDVILPCQLDPAEDATVMTVEWARPDLEPRFVHVLHDGLELDEKKYHLYMGRTSLLNNQLMYGDVSLKLATVKLSDEGKYKCFIPTLSKEISAHVILQHMLSAASSPVLTINKDTSAVVLDCESKGWHPKPELFWLDGEGNLLPAGAPETVRGPDGLYTVSSRVTVEKSHSNKLNNLGEEGPTEEERERQKLMAEKEVKKDVKHEEEQKKENERKQREELEKQLTKLESELKEVKKNEETEKKLKEDAEKMKDEYKELLRKTNLVLKNRGSELEIRLTSTQKKTMKSSEKKDGKVKAVAEALKETNAVFDEVQRKF